MSYVTLASFHYRKKTIVPPTKLNPKHSQPFISSSSSNSPRPLPRPRLRPKEAWTPSSPQQTTPEPPQLPPLFRRLLQSPPPSSGSLVLPRCLQHRCLGLRVLLTWPWLLQSVWFGFGVTKSPASRVSESLQHQAPSSKAGLCKG